MAQWGKACTQKMLKRLGCRRNKTTDLHEGPGNRPYGASYSLSMAMRWTVPSVPGLNPSWELVSPWL
jgi:hypothetical protein